MSSIVDSINFVFTNVATFAYGVFSFIPKSWGLLLLSFVAGVLLLLLYGKVSNQKGLKRVKDRIYSYVLESVLFRHDIRTALAAQGRMFVLAGVYLGHALPALLVLAIPCIILLAQMNLWYGYLPLQMQGETVLTARLADSAQLQQVQLETSPNVEAVTPALRIAEQKVVQWRIKMNTTDQGYLTLKVGDSGQKETIPVIGMNHTGSIPTGRYSDWWWSLLYPGQQSLSETSGFEELSLRYPEQDYPLLGVNMHWIFVFLIISIVAGLIGSKLFKVEI